MTINLCNADEKIREREMEAGYITYKTLADMVGGAVLCNAMADRLYETMEPVSGLFTYYEDSNGNRHSPDEHMEEFDDLLEKAYHDELDEEGRERLEELGNLSESYAEIFQWYIISDAGKDTLEQFAPTETIFYDSELGIYVWGITHYGTAWSYVFTDVPCEKEV